METASLETIDFRVRLRTPQMPQPRDPDQPPPHCKQDINFYNMRPRRTPRPMDVFVKSMSDGDLAIGVVCNGCCRSPLSVTAIRPAGNNL